ncbi:MAG: hypothetical protein MK135_05565, partial [Polyangiaceae bacterium]|nr:hypothetical protein [Polyangiaceae bacterium]
HAEILLNLDEPRDLSSSNSATPSSDGLFIRYNEVQDSGSHWKQVRLHAEDNNIYCAQFENYDSGFRNWSEFSTRCWDSESPGEFYDGSPLLQVGIYIGSSEWEEIRYDFCIDSLLDRPYYDDGNYYGGDDDGEGGGSGMGGSGGDDDDDEGGSGGSSPLPVNYVDQGDWFGFKSFSSGPALTIDNEYSSDNSLSMEIEGQVAPGGGADAWIEQSWNLQEDTGASAQGYASALGQALRVSQSTPDGSTTQLILSTENGDFCKELYWGSAFIPWTTFRANCDGTGDAYNFEKIQSVTRRVLLGGVQEEDFSAQLEGIYSSNAGSIGYLESDDGYMRGFGTATATTGATIQSNVDVTQQAEAAYCARGTLPASTAGEGRLSFTLGEDRYATMQELFYPWEDGLSLNFESRNMGSNGFIELTNEFGDTYCAPLIPSDGNEAYVAWSEFTDDCVGFNGTPYDLSGLASLAIVARGDGAQTENFDFCLYSYQQRQTPRYGYWENELYTGDDYVRWAGHVTANHYGNHDGQVSDNAETSEWPSWCMEGNVDVYDGSGASYSELVWNLNQDYGDSSVSTSPVVGEELRLYAYADSGDDFRVTIDDGDGNTYCQLVENRWDNPWILSWANFSTNCHDLGNPGDYFTGTEVQSIAISGRTEENDGYFHICWDGVGTDLGGDDDDDHGGMGGSSGYGGSSGSDEWQACEGDTWWADTETLIDDFESGGFPMVPERDNRMGEWTYSHHEGVEALLLSTDGGNSFVSVSCSTDSHCSTAPDESTPWQWAEVKFNLSNPPDCYSPSGYEGIRFKVRSGTGSGQFRLLGINVDANPEFGETYRTPDYDLSDQWETYEVPWYEFQAPVWAGIPSEFHVDTMQSIVFEIRNGEAFNGDFGEGWDLQPYDLQIDDVEFY